MNIIIFTGGGSGGHAVPAATLVTRLKQLPDTNILYIGSKTGIEKEIISKLDIPYYIVRTGKLRRYFSLQNFLDIFNILIGTIQSFLIVRKVKKHYYKIYNKKKSHLSSPPAFLLFSTGGFITVPPVIAAWFSNIPSFIHEQTTRVGLANKICSYFAAKIFISFESSSKFFPHSKTHLSYYPLREEVYSNRAELPKDIKIKSSKPVLFVTGGGNGSFLFNTVIQENRQELEKYFTIIHQTGRQFYRRYIPDETAHYIVRDFFPEMIQIMKYADVIMSRAGAGTVSEIITLQKKALFIPLKIAQKNEQYYNALEAKKYTIAKVISEQELVSIDLPAVLLSLYNEKLQKNKFLSPSGNGTEMIAKQIEEYFNAYKLT
jgi:UDP-N-acetylglucosamine--N-acetylmuramyl-(pentapeptide) pyrophosphoryl-undecaprenol N-acetylglucosamine transferase